MIITVLGACHHSVYACCQKLRVEEEDLPLWVISCCESLSFEIDVVHHREHYQWWWTKGRDADVANFPVWDFWSHPKLSITVQTVQNQDIWIITGLFNGIMMTHRAYIDTPFSHTFLYDTGELILHLPITLEPADIGRWSIHQGGRDMNCADGPR